MNVFDWDKCRAWVADRQPTEVSGGIAEDWYWTGATIYENGEWRKEHGAYLQSSWGSPAFKAEMPNGDTIEVYCYREANEDDLKRIAADREKRMAEMKLYIKSATKELAA